MLSAELSKRLTESQLEKKAIEQKMLEVWGEWDRLKLERVERSIQAQIDKAERESDSPLPKPLSRGKAIEFLQLIKYHPVMLMVGDDWRLGIRFLHKWEQWEKLMRKRGVVVKWVEYTAFEDKEGTVYLAGGGGYVVENE